MGGRPDPRKPAQRSEQDRGIRSGGPTGPDATRESMRSETERRNRQNFRPERGFSHITILPPCCASATISGRASARISHTYPAVSEPGGVAVSVESSVRMSSRQQSGIQYRNDDDLVQVDPADALRTVQGVGGDPRTLTEELPPLTLPGHGEEYDDCGDDLPHFCSGCGEVHAVGRTCRRKECPRCAPAWVVERATAAGAKIEATRRYLAASRGESPRFHHLVFSPPEGFAVDREDPLSAGYEIVKNLLDELGTDGGVIIYHPWRGKDNDDRGFWKNVLFEENEWSETVQRLEYAPHFHVIALGRFIPGEQFTKKLYEQTGWAYKRITKGGDNTESNVSLYDEYDLARALTYSLSHAGVSGSHDAYRYFGRVHNLAAEGHIEEGINAVVRSVAPDTLGIPYRSTSCTRELDEDEETATEGATGSAPSNPDSAMADERDDDQDNRQCGGRLLHIRQAPLYLRDLDWIETVGRADELAEAYWWWLRGEPPPD